MLAANPFPFFYILYISSISPVIPPAYEFLIAIAEPISRPIFVHEYLLTRFSLYASGWLGLWGRGSGLTEATILSYSI